MYKRLFFFSTFAHCTLTSSAVPRLHKALCRLRGITSVSAASPRRISFSWRFITKASVAERNFGSAGCSVCCRVQTCNQLEVSWDSSYRGNKCFACAHYVFHPWAEPTDLYACDRQGVGTTQRRSSNTLMEQKQLISWSCGLKIDYFLTAACGSFWINGSRFRVTQQFSIWTVQMRENSLISSTSCTQQPKHVGSSVTSLP